MGLGRIVVKDRPGNREMTHLGDRELPSGAIFSLPVKHWSDADGYGDFSCDTRVQRSYDDR
jgi:hypothetical protein